MCHNSSSFQPGPDPRRHTFTRAERKRGYRNAVEKHPSFHVSAWVWRKVRGYYRARKRERKGG